jgi:hypothetical protein
MTADYGNFAFPAKAGTHPSSDGAAEEWISAFAGNAIFFCGRMQ